MNEQAGENEDRTEADPGPFKVLVVDDEKLYAQAICRELRRNGIECDDAYCAAEALRLSQTGCYQAILLDHKLPDDDGIRIIPILLDEIGDMDLSLQGKLLRVLETRCFQRVGSVQEHPVNARIIAATNRNLMELVGEGRFRFDLYQRLTVFPIRLPPLRERKEDIILLADHFISFFSKQMDTPIKPLQAGVQERLTAYDFPGNVRELKNVIERAAIMADAGVIELHHLPERVLTPPAEPAAEESRPQAGTVDFIAGIDTLETLERKLITNALQQTRGVKVEAARLLGISRFQLLRRLEKYGMKQAGDDGEMGQS